MALIGGNKDGKTDAKANVNKRNRSAARDAETSSFADDPLDPMLGIKKRARRRLIGAIALVVGAIVFIPMIFDSGKNPVVDDISIQIPDKNTPFEPDKPATKQATAQVPVQVPPQVPATQLNNTTGNTTSTVDQPKPEPTSAAVSSSAAEIAKQTAVVVQPEPKPAEKKLNEKMVEPTKDDPRAVALLEGKTEAAKEEKASSYAVQIGAFSDPEKVKFLREKLASGGFKAFTEIVKTPQGERTRLRVGPYSDRAEADKAQERVKKLFVLDGTVVPLGSPGQ